MIITTSLLKKKRAVAQRVIALNATEERKMNDIASLLAEDTVTEITDDQMGSLGEAVNQLLAKQQEIVTANEALKLLAAEERKISQVTIPEMMENLGFESITLSTGEKVAVKDSIQCSIPAAMRPDAYKWLDDNNHGGLIKANLNAKFPRDSQTEQQQAVDALAAIGVVASLVESVHAGTLKAWAREELAQGHSLPGDLFKVVIIKQTTVK